MGYIKEILPKIIRYRLFRLGLVSPGTPLNLTFSVTNLCQSRCRTCSIWKLYRDNPDKREDELTIEEIEKIFKSLGHVYVCNISGGEPFLRQDFSRIIELACRYLTPAIIHIPTNAIAVNIIEKKTREILEIIKKINPGIQLTVKPSLDHAGEKHDEIRGIKGNFEKVADLFKRLKSMKTEYPNLHVELGTVISNWNVNDIEEISRFAMAMEPDSYRNEIAEKRSEMFNLEDPITPEVEFYRKAIDVFIRQIQEKKHELPFFQRINNAFRMVYYRIAIRVMEENRQVIPCYAGISNAHMSPYGDIWPCCTLGYNMSMGNLRDYNYNFNLLWSSSDARKVRKYIKDKKCCCPLANQTYSNILMHLPSLAKVIKNLLNG
ncbi:MAG: radical SAM protein [Desulfobacteraceae bacterium]|jgi:MoaA/NifB/PqqE/SkfB family radical SAM enzyme